MSSPSSASDTAPVESPVTGFGFFRVFLGWTLGIVLLYFLLISVIDPRRHFGGHWFPQVVPVPAAERLLLFEKYQQAAPVTGLILGNSRTMTLPPELLDRLTGLRFFNAGVFGGLPDDHLALYRLLVERGLRPAVLLIGIDDISLNDVQPATDETKSNYALARQIQPAANGPVGRFRHVARLYHESMNPEAVVEIWRGIRQKISPREVINLFHPDGRVSYPRAEGKIASGINEMEQLIRDDTIYLSTLRKTAVLSPRRMEYLEALLSEARAQNTRVRMFVTPYHPKLLSAIQSDPVAWQHHVMALAYYRSLEGRFGVRLTDYTDEASFGGTPDNWYDGVHFRMDNAIKLIQQTVRDGI